MGSVKPVQRERHVHFQEVAKSDADNITEPQCELGFYISPFDGKKKMTASNPAILEQERAELERITEEESSIIFAEDL